MPLAVNENEEFYLEKWMKRDDVTVTMVLLRSRFGMGKCLMTSFPTTDTQKLRDMR
jgi:hypothetical protein